jgi:hypothetical protein
MPTSITSSGITFDDATTQTTSALAAGAIGTTQLASAAVTPAKLSQPLTLSTAVATTSGTSIDFTSIPSWVRRITVMLNGVSTSSTSNLLLRLGTSSGFVSSGYESIATEAASTVATTTSTAGMLLQFDTAAAETLNGQYVLTNITGNAWVMAGSGKSGSWLATASGYSALAATLDRVRLTTVNGTDTFDAGSVNIIYEG